MIQTILGLCARDQGHEAMYEALDRELLTYRTNSPNWPELLDSAEKHGLCSLLYKHLSALEFKLPKTSSRTLQSLYLRNRRSSHLRIEAITEIVKEFGEQNIDTLLVKGIALGNFAYSSPELRPMRDIDLLVRKGDLLRARELLFDSGYRTQETHHIPEDYYHLAPLEKTVEGLPINIELHHNLLPLQQNYPLWPLDKSYFSSRIIEIKNRQVHTLNLEESLWYVYLHGLQAPLTYEKFRFIHIADLVSLVEKYLLDIDWDLLRLNHPLLVDILSRLHFVTPWQHQVIERLQLRIDQVPARPAVPYNGWPRRRFRQTGPRDLPKLLKDTFRPSQWWLQTYYGQIRGYGYLKVLFFEHPRTIWRWCKTYVRDCFSPAGK